MTNEEVAQRLGVNRRTPTRWAQKYPDYPDGGSWEQIREWAVTMGRYDDVVGIATPRRGNVRQECGRGHEYNEENTYYSREGGRQRRTCRECKRRANREAARRRRQTGL